MTLHQSRTCHSEIWMYGAGHKDSHPKVCVYYKAINWADWQQYLRFPTERVFSANGDVATARTVALSVLPYSGLIGTDPYSYCFECLRTDHGGNDTKNPLPCLKCRDSTSIVTPLITAHTKLVFKKKWLLMTTLLTLLIYHYSRPLWWNSDLKFHCQRRRQPLCSLLEDHVVPRWLRSTTTYH